MWAASISAILLSPTSQSCSKSFAAGPPNFEAYSLSPRPGPSRNPGPAKCSFRRPCMRDVVSAHCGPFLASDVPAWHGSNPQASQNAIRNDRIRALSGWHVTRPEAVLFSRGAAGANFRIAHNPESSGKPSMSLNKVEVLDGPRSIFIDGASFQEWLLPVAFDTSDAISARWSLSHWPVMTINSLKLLLPERT